MTDNSAIRAETIRAQAAERLVKSPGYAEVLAAAQAPKHEPRKQMLTDGKTFRIWCSCQTKAQGKNVRGRMASTQAAFHIADAHNRGESC